MARDDAEAPPPADPDEGPDEGEPASAGLYDLLRNNKKWWLLPMIAVLLLLLAVVALSASQSAPFMYRLVQGGAAPALGAAG
jgi:uncharacterized integral membrane protein